VTAGASAITTDANNNVIVTGSLWDGADYDMFTAKWNAAGTLVWYAIQASAAGGWDGGNGLVADSAGNVYAAGMMDGWTEGVVVKYAAAEDPANPGHGDEQWVHHFLGTAAYEQASCEAIAIDSSGRIYVTGYRATATGGVDIFVSRLQADGGGVWLRGYNSYRKRGDYATSIATGNGGIWVAGNADKPHNATDVALLHYSASGHRVWVRTWDDSLHKGENVAGLGIDRYGNAYLAAEVWPTSSAYKVALIKYAHSGTRRWTKLYRGVTGDTGGLQCSDMAVSPGGSAWLVGSLFTAGDAFWKVVKYNRAGKRLWTTTWPTGQPGGPTSGQPWACVLSGTSDLFVAGDAVQTIGGRNATAGWFVWLESEAGGGVRIRRTPAPAQPQRRPSEACGVARRILLVDASSHQGGDHDGPRSVCASPASSSARPDIHPRHPCSRPQRIRAERLRPGPWCRDLAQELRRRRRRLR
jgi:hypothetical protein